MVYEHTSPEHVLSTFRDFLQSSAHHQSGYHVRVISYHGRDMSFEAGKDRYNMRISGPIGHNYACNLKITPEQSEAITERFSFAVTRKKHGKLTQIRQDSHLGLLNRILDIRKQQSKQ